MISASRSIERGQNLKTDKKMIISVQSYIEEDDVTFQDDLGILDNPSKMGTKVISTSPSTTLDPIIRENVQCPVQNYRNSRKGKGRSKDDHVSPTKMKTKGHDVSDTLNSKNFCRQKSLNSDALNSKDSCQLNSLNSDP